MPSESQIIAEIESIVTYYVAWTIGITDDLDRRKREHNNPRYWHQWDAITESSARKIEKNFLDKGMQGATGGGISPNYVYIFMP